jgi:hypothetical protein
MEEMKNGYWMLMKTLAEQGEAKNGKAAQKND